MESFSIKDGSFCIAEFLIVLPLFQVFLDKPSISIWLQACREEKQSGEACASPQKRVKGESTPCHSAGRELYLCASSKPLPSAEMLPCPGSLSELPHWSSLVQSLFPTWPTATGVSLRATQWLALPCGLGQWQCTGI